MFRKQSKKKKNHNLMGTLKNVFRTYFVSQENKNFVHRKMFEMTK